MKSLFKEANKTADFDRVYSKYMITILSEYMLILTRKSFYYNN